MTWWASIVTCCASMVTCVGLHGDLLRLELVRLQPERGVLALEARVACGSRELAGLVALRGSAARALGRLAHVPSTSSTSAASPTGLKGFVR